MSFESFRIELRGASAARSQVEECVAQLPHVKPDPDALAVPGSAYHALEDGTHIIEIEVSPSAVVSCRFTLCHPPSIDAALLGLSRELMTLLRMESRVCDDTPPEHSGWYSLARFPEFAEAVSRHAAARRREWVANFGPVQLPAKTHEVYEKIILPRCEPVSGVRGD